MNKVILIGNLTKDLELKFTPGNNTAVATGTLAVQRKRKNKDGKYESDFINIVIWGAVAENTCKYNGGKGEKLGVTGRMETRSYEAKDGSKRYITEVIVEEVEFLKGNKDGNTSQDIPSDYFGNGDMTPIDDGEDMPF